MPANPQTSVVPFSFDGAAVRVVTREGEPWFVLADVCKVLDISNAPHAASRLDDEERMTIASNDGHSGQRGGAQSMTVINESGLYSLVLTSRKPDAKRFKKWITSGARGARSVADYRGCVTSSDTCMILVFNRDGKQSADSRRPDRFPFCNRCFRTRYAMACRATDGWPVQSNESIPA